jgi:hypothetical protein
MAPEGNTILDRLTAQGLTILVESRGRLAFASDGRGLDPLKQVVAHRPELLDGADVALPAVGLGVGYLLIGLKVGRVFARLMTHEAHKAFEAEGIEHAAGERVKRLPPEEAAGLLDDRARAAPTMLAFVEELKQTAK